VPGHPLLGFTVDRWVAVNRNVSAISAVIALTLFGTSFLIQCSPTDHGAQLLVCTPICAGWQTHPALTSGVLGMAVPTVWD
jgi:hypothetical protein